jgi:hypothetical protein
MSNRLAGMQQSSLPYPSSSSGWHPPTAISSGQGSGTSSQTAQGKRRRRSSWDDEEDSNQEFGGETRARGESPPPARRPRIATDPERVSISALFRTNTSHVLQDWNAPSSSSIPASMRAAPSRGFSAQGYPAYRGHPTNWGGQAVGSLTVGQQGSNPYESVPSRHLEENRYPGHTRQMTDMRMRSASPLHLPSSDEGRPLAGGSGAQNHPTFNPQHWNVNQGWDIYPSQQVEERGMEIPRTHQQPLRGRRKRSPFSSPPQRLIGESFDFLDEEGFGITLNIGSAGNVFAGDNYGANFGDTLRDTCRAEHGFRKCLHGINNRRISKRFHGTFIFAASGAS